MRRELVGSGRTSMHLANDGIAWHQRSEINANPYHTNEFGFFVCVLDNFVLAIGGKEYHDVFFPFLFSLSLSLSFFFGGCRILVEINFFFLSELLPLSLGIVRNLEFLSLDLPNKIKKSNGIVIAGVMVYRKAVASIRLYKRS